MQVRFIIRRYEVTLFMLLNGQSLLKSGHVIP